MGLKGLVSRLKNVAHQKILSVIQVQNLEAMTKRCSLQPPKKQRSVLYRRNYQLMSVTYESWNNSLDTVKYLVEEAKADVNLPPESRNSGCALTAAIVRGNLDILRYFAEEVKPAVDLLVHVRIYGNVLATAAFAGRLDVVRYLVEEANIGVNLQLGEDSFGSVLVAAT